MLEASLLPPIPSAFARGEDLALLDPMSFLGDVAAAVPPNPRVDRAELAAAMQIANAGYGHPAAAEMASKLADPATRVVVTGQQPGLFGGPLYTLSKAVAAARWVERFEQAGQPAVAVFWVATEDHDFREVSNAVFLTSEGARRFELGEDESPLTPVGMRTLGPAVATVIDELRAANPGERWAEWIDRVAQWYRPDARFGEAFSRLLAGLMGARCPLLLDSMLPALKEAQRPWLRRVVEERHEIGAAFAERERSIGEAGYELQVRPSPGASPLFFLHGSERRRIEWRGDDRIALRGEDDFERPIEWLLEAIDENPGVVSPGVMARTAMQDATLGTSILVFGPGEVSYIPQVAPLYSQLGLEPPLISLRPQALVLAHHQLDKLSDLEIGLDQLVASDFDLGRRPEPGGALGQDPVADRTGARGVHRPVGRGGRAHQRGAPQAGSRPEGVVSASRRAPGARPLHVSLPG
jgi:bacillithiol biosynthesis cysteine-adding enzyme BshC